MHAQQVPQDQGRPLWLACFLIFLTSASMGRAGEAVMAPTNKLSPKTLWLYVGTYTNGKTPSEGIYLLELDLASGSVTSKGAVARLANPTFLAIGPDRKVLYAINEVDKLGGKKGGGVSALAIDPASGKLTLLNQESSVGNGPCHLSVDRAGKCVLVANYGSGSVACLPIHADGSLAPASSFIQHEGTSIHADRQGGPHAHSINLDPANRYAFAADLGLDKILVYRFEADKGSLVPNQPPFAKVAPGSGPRHFALHPGGRYAYVINEMANTVTAFTYDADKGTLTEIQTISTLPADFKGKSYTAEVQVHPSGKFVYGSNRGHHSLAIFAVDPTSGRLTAAGHQPTMGKNPRNFALDPTGKYLLAENQDSDSIVVFRIDPTRGGLKQVGEPIRIPMPVCIRMIPKPGESD
jgi:6-phosphogluconolactonase